ncbi:MAG: thioredoxin-dependent thiol peroxidase [Gemmatimonadaceae bacterium]|nr:thioredoxin-dependent thiol peroxidase [Gemmatimonadaceae bacterium]MCW5826724.1 thioredoxin-dependent thiol peroxidase [Gemmatimonadaceae bacterium]
MKLGTEYSTVRVGDIAPDFTLPTDAGEPLTLSSLRGKRVVLFFYPKDSSPGCTIEACGFRDLVPRFKRRGVAVLGIAPGTVRSKARFKAAQGLNFPLLNDAEQQAAEAYGVWREKLLFGHRYMGVMRTTYVIGTDGRVEAVWEHVEHEGHATEVDAFLRGAPPPVRASQVGRAAKKK